MGKRPKGKFLIPTKYIQLLRLEKQIEYDPSRALMDWMLTHKCHYSRTPHNVYSSVDGPHYALWEVMRYEKSILV